MKATEMLNKIKELVGVEASQEVKLAQATLEVKSMIEEIKAMIDNKKKEDKEDMSEDEKENLSKVEKINHNPEEKTNTNTFLYAQDRNATVLDRIFERLNK